jgi:hypothetical protein
MNSKTITYVTAILLLLTLSACSKNVTTEDYTEEQLRELIIGSWSCHPSDYLCDTYNLDHGTEITLEVKNDHSLNIKNLPVVLRWDPVMVNGNGSWRLEEGIYRKMWELRLSPKQINLNFPINVKEKKNSIYLDYVINPDYSSEFVFQKSKGFPLT